MKIFKQQYQTFSGITNELLNRVAYMCPTKQGFTPTSGQHQRIMRNRSAEIGLPETGSHIKYLSQDKLIFSNEGARLNEMPGVMAVIGELNREVINDTLQRFAIEGLDFLVINDLGKAYSIWQGLKIRTKVLAIRFNPEYTQAISRYPTRNSPGQGSSYRALVGFGANSFYTLICQYEDYLFFTDLMYRELFPELIGTGLTNYKDYFTERITA
jgi:hypothetical protein